MQRGSLTPDFSIPGSVIFSNLGEGKGRLAVASPNVLRAVHVIRLTTPRKPSTPMVRLPAAYAPFLLSFFHLSHLSSLPNFLSLTFSIHVIRRCIRPCPTYPKLPSPSGPCSSPLPSPRKHFLLPTHVGLVVLSQFALVLPFNPNNFLRQTARIILSAYRTFRVRHTLTNSHKPHSYMYEIIPGTVM